MKLTLTSAEVVTAVKEFMVKRGVPSNAEVDVFLRGGRKGKSGTIEVDIAPNVLQEIEETPPQSYQNLVKKEPSIADATYDAEELDYVNDARQMAEDMEIFEPELVIKPKPEFKIVEVPNAKTTLGNLFGDIPEDMDIKLESSTKPLKGLFE